jgi:hypothetical protein
MNNINSMKNINKYILQGDVFVDDEFLGFRYFLTKLYSSRATCIKKALLIAS